MKEETDAWGFDQYNITWKNNKEYFELRAFGLNFFGTYREETDTNGYAYHIDIYVQVKDQNVLGKDIHSMGVISIPYEEDPRDNIRCLRSDICAAINQWDHKRCSKGVMYQDLINYLKMPNIEVYQLSQVVELIDKLSAIISTTGKGIAQIGGTSLIINLPKSSIEKIEQKNYPPSQTPHIKISKKLHNAYIEYQNSEDSSPECDKRFRKKIRRLGWKGGLNKLRDHLK